MALETTDDRTIDPVPDTTVGERVGDPFTLVHETRSTLTVDGPTIAPAPVPEIDARPTQGDSLLDVDPTESLAVLDDPRLVLSEGYVGLERRRARLRARLIRSTHVSRRRLLRLEALVVAALAIMVVGAGLIVTSSGHPLRTPTADVAPTTVHTRSDPVGFLPHTPTTVPAPAVIPTSATGAATVPEAPVGDTPDAMGAAALALIHYPWQQLTGYSIVFRPISDAPSPGYYGNTSFTWGRAGGTSTLYVYPGETIQRLAGITAFEIGHEVDAAYVEPQGGHQAIAALLGVHPASWAPECDCAEQGYLSGWYAAAFSNYWSPGVGQWSSLAPEPSGATLIAMQPWLDPRIS